MIRKILPAVLDMLYLLDLRICFLRDMVEDWQRQEISILDFEHKKFNHYYLHEIETYLERFAEKKAELKCKEYDDMLGRIEKKLDILRIK